MHGTMEGGVLFMLENFSYLSALVKNESEKSNYRPIAVLSCMSRILEKIICRLLYEYCVSHGLLIRDNVGYKRNNSTVNQRLAI